MASSCENVRDLTPAGSPVVLHCHYEKALAGEVTERTIRGRIDQKGRIAIPASFREALGIRDGGEVIVQLRNDELSITTQQLRIRRAQQRARKYLQPGVSLADELLVERREEMER